MKVLCRAVYEKDGIDKKPGDMAQYKECLLHYFPHIVDVTLFIPRGGYSIKPFMDWAKEKLFWWSEYNEIKHQREKNWNKANLKNAVYTVAALRVINLYLKRFYGKNQYYLANLDSPVFYSEYTSQVNFVRTENKDLPDFAEE